MTQPLHYDNSWRGKPGKSHYREGEMLGANFRIMRHRAADWWDVEALCCGAIRPQQTRTLSQLKHTKACAACRYKKVEG